MYLAKLVAQFVQQGPPKHFQVKRVDEATSKDRSETTTLPQLIAEQNDLLRDRNTLQRANNELLAGEIRERAKQSALLAEMCERLRKSNSLAKKMLDRQSDEEEDEDEE